MAQDDELSPTRCRLNVVVPGQETNPMHRSGFVLYIPTSELSISSFMVRVNAAANIYLSIKIRNGKVSRVKSKLFILTHFNG